MNRICHTFLFVACVCNVFSQISFYKVPPKTFNPYLLMGDTTRKITYNLPAFEISAQITLNEYKQYLLTVQKDSGDVFYYSQLPDSNICERNAYKKYITASSYDDFPVVGISWDNALNYCKWKTLKDNKDSISFYYCLPRCSEWLIAKDYLEKQKTKNDFGKNYSDWILGMYDESWFAFDKDIGDHFLYDDVYFGDPKKDSRVMKRKYALGDSFKFQRKNELGHHMSLYSFEGYSYVGFRIMKIFVSQIMKDKDLKVLQYYGLKH